MSDFLTWLTELVASMTADVTGPDPHPHRPRARGWTGTVVSRHADVAATWPVDCAVLWSGKVLS